MEVCLTAFGAYLLVAIPTLFLYPTLTVWPAAGIAFAAGYLGGFAGAVGIFLGTMVSNLTWVNLHRQALPMETVEILSIAGANALAALAASALLRRLNKGGEPFDSPGDTLRFCTLGAGLYAIITTAIAAMPQSSRWQSLALFDLYLRNYVGVVIVAPPLLVWIARAGKPLLLSRKGEVLFLSLLAIFITSLIFGPGYGAIDPTFRLGVLLLVPLYWVATRFDMRLSTGLTLLCFLLVLRGTAMEYGVFGHLVQGSNQIMRAQLFFGTIGVILLFTGSMAETRERAEAKLKMAFENTKQLISSANVIILGMNQTGELKIFNRTAEQITGYSMEELSGINWFEIISTTPGTQCNDGETSWANPFREYHESGQLSQEFETTIWTKTGEERLIAWQNSPIRTVDGDISMICYGMDITERRHAEETLKTSAEQILDLYENAPCGYHSVDGEGVVLRINDTELQRLGYAADEVLGHNIRDYINPASLAQFEESFAKLSQKEEIRDVEVELVRRDGSILPIALSSTVIRDEAGNFLMTRSTTFDLTERRQANAQLRETRKFLDSIIDNIPNMVFVKEHENLRFLRLNKAGEELLGVDRKDIIGKNDYDLFPKEEADFFTAKDREVMARGTLLDISEEPILTPTGTRLLHTQKIPVFDESGNPRYLLGISQDITELRRAEEELKRFFELSINLFCFAGFDGYFKRLNPAWETLLGYSREELMASPFIEFVHPEDKASTIAVSQQLTMGKEAISFENRYRCKDGSYCWLLWQARSVVGEHLIYAAAHDCTERKKAEQALLETTQDLRRSNEQLEQFAYVASHDLQEPLRMVGSYTMLLRQRYQGKLDADADKFIDYAVQGSKRMQMLIQDLLAYSRVGTKGIPFEIVSTEEVLATVLAILKLAIEEEHAEVTHDPLPEIFGEPIQLSQLFQNLISNAIKFHGKEPPKVHISAARGVGEWVFSVSDNGIGICPEYFERIFAIFQRLHSRDRYEGTGIGLAVCKKIVELHDGRIWVETSRPESPAGNGNHCSSEGDDRHGKPGQGTTFCFTISDLKTRNI